MEWDENIFDTTSDDGGEADYTIEGTSSSFEIQARYQHGPNVNLYLSGMSTVSEAQGTTIDLGFVWNETTYPYYNAMTIIIAGVDGRFVCNSTNQLSVPWLQMNFPTLGERSLRQICLPASHDSGMSTIGPHTFFGNAADCQTQTGNIGQQLRYGIRVLDVRPVTSQGDYYTGHYSNTNMSGINWQGADGEKISDVLNEINAFTDSFPELVVLQISHAYDTDGTYSDFSQAQWDGLFPQLASLRHLFVAPAGTTDLTQLTLNQFIGNQQAAVVLVFPFNDGSGLSLGNYAGQGFYYQSQFPINDDYANSDDPNTMINDQVSKLQAQRASPTDEAFSLDWTLTQQGEETVLGPPILELANRANSWLAPTLIPKVSSSVYPNLLSMDKIQDTIPVAVATAVNCIATGA